jgi:hypothetical protein
MMALTALIIIYFQVLFFVPSGQVSTLSTQFQQRLFHHPYLKKELRSCRQVGIHVGNKFVIRRETFLKFLSFGGSFALSFFLVL